VDAQIETAFRFVKKDDKWQIAEIRTGDNRWEDIELIARSINQEKTERAKAELESMATALEAFKRERGSYIISKEQSVLIDNLNPRYLSRIIRYDPWHKPYLYEGTQTSYTLRSAGEDGKENTADDLIRTSNLPTL
jgi:ribosomal protein L22